MGAEPLGGKTSKTSCLRLCPQLAVSCGVPGAGTAWGQPAPLGLGEIWELQEGAGKGRKSQRQAASNIFPPSSRGQTSPWSPPLPFPAWWGGDVISSISIPSAAGKEPQPRGTSAAAAAVATSPRRPRPQRGTKPQLPAVGDSQQRPLPADGQGCQEQPGWRGSGWDMEAALPEPPGLLGLEPALSACRKLPSRRVKATVAKFGLLGVEDHKRINHHPPLDALNNVRTLPPPP